MIGLPCRWSVIETKYRRKVLSNSHPKRDFIKNLVKHLVWTNWQTFHCTGSRVCLSFWCFFYLFCFSFSIIILLCQQNHLLLSESHWLLFVIQHDVLIWIILTFSAKTVIIQAMQNFLWYVETNREQDLPWVYEVQGKLKSWSF